jgi:hypothetical protein
VLDWTDYIDEAGFFQPEYYYIYRGTKPDSLVFHDSISSFSTEYNDLAPQGALYYRIIVKKTSVCDPTLHKASNGPYSQSLSNVEDNRLKGSGILDSDYGTNLSLHPNPFDKILNINYSLIDESNVAICLLDAKGVILSEICNELQQPAAYSTEFVADPDLPAGMYFLKMRVNGTVLIRKIIKK